MSKYLDLTGLTTFKSKLDTTYAKKADVYDKTAADGLLSAKANSSDVYTKAQVDSAIAGAGGIPTITIAVSQVISQSPLQIQLTNEQYTTMNGHSVLLDASALNMPVVVADYNGTYNNNGTNIMHFVFLYAGTATSEEETDFNSIAIDVSTKIATVKFADTRIASAYRSYTSETVDYSVDVPTSNNPDWASNIKIVVLSSEPATRYDGYLYIITGSNS